MSNKQIILKVLSRYDEILKNESMERTLTQVLSDKRLRESFAEDIANELEVQNTVASRNKKDDSLNDVCLN